MSHMISRWEMVIIPQREEHRQVSHMISLGKSSEELHDPSLGVCDHQRADHCYVSNEKICYWVESVVIGKSNKGRR